MTAARRPGAPPPTPAGGGNGAEREESLLARFRRSEGNPRLMMLYPPISTGHAYLGEVGAGELWAGTPASGTLYVHVPFCRTRCPFCPFYAVVGDEREHERYVETLLAEAGLYARAVEGVAFTSVYLGGGTPSVLPPALVGTLLRGLGRRLRIQGADVSLEAHPSDVTPESVRAWCEAGVTRVSLGVQSFDPRVLAACGRGETARVVEPALRAALDSPLRDVNVDLMYGLPEQSVSSWERDLETAARLGVPGLTLYATVYLPPFAAQCDARGYSVATREERLAMYDLAHEFLSGAGYPQPRFGAGAFLRGALNAHRRNVALGLPTLGLGTWAYSSSGPFSYHNLVPRERWAEEVRAGRLPIRQLVVIPEEERARKYVIEALLLAYVSLPLFHEAFGTPLDRAFPHELAVLDRLGLATVADGELRLTRTGGRHLREIRYLFASDAVVAAIEEGGGEGL